MDTYSPSYSINKTHIYHVSKHSSSHNGSLIDRGANGGDMIYIKTQVFRLLRYYSQQSGILLEATGQPKTLHTT